MIHIAGGIILAVLGLRALSLIVALSLTDAGIIFWSVVALLVFVFGLSLIKGDGLMGGFVILGMLAGMLWLEKNKYRYDNSSVDWRHQSELDLKPLKTDRYGRRL